MPSLYLTTPGLRAHLEKERIVVAQPIDSSTENTPPAEVHLRDIERLFVSEQTAISLAAIAELLRRDTPVIILSRTEKILGLCHPLAPHAETRYLQYQRVSDPAFCLAMAITVVEAKILNQRRVLQRLAANREDAEVTPTILALKTFANECTRAASIETLRGYEGTAAGRYFEEYGAFFPKDAPFQRRSRRPPQNAPNAILSYCYTLLAAEVECLLHSFGLDPAIGFYHEPADRRASLALDLIEPFRAPVADALALDLLSHGTLNPKSHFESREGGVYLNAEGKRRFFVAYERRMDREFTSEFRHCRTTLRGELEQQARAAREAFVNGEPLEPFQMN